MGYTGEQPGGVHALYVGLGRRNREARPWVWGLRYCVEGVIDILIIPIAGINLALRRTALGVTSGRHHCIP